MQHERYTNADHEVLVLQKDGRLRITREGRFSSDPPRVHWVSGQDAIFTELLRWDVPLDAILRLPGFEGYEVAVPDER